MQPVQTQAARPANATPAPQTWPTQTSAATGATDSPAAVSAVINAAATPPPIAFAVRLAPADLPAPVSPPPAKTTQDAVNPPATPRLAADVPAPVKVTTLESSDSQPTNPAPQKPAAQKPREEAPAPVREIAPRRQDDPAPQARDLTPAADSAVLTAPEKTASPETANAAPAGPPVGDAAAPLRVPESVLSAPAPSSAPVQQITVRISQPDAAPVDLHVSERGGQVHVTVRTADPAMQDSLKQDLGTLANSLQHAGYRAEVFAGRETAPAAREAALQTSSSRRDSQDHAGSGGRGGWGNSQQGRQQSARDQRQKSWREELENSK